MFDVVLKGGDVVDGTGAARRRADVAIRGGRVVEIGAPEGSARRVIDVSGLVIAPGFVDIHTHYDAQVHWDSALSPSPLHGVTTIIGGNCGFSIAPLAPGHEDYLMRMMARVEGIPLGTLAAGAPWDWDSFGSWLNRLEQSVVVNAGFLVGHSAVRRLVMGEASVGEEATDDQIAQMVDLVHRAIAEGALGFSSSAGEHVDGDGAPVPSRAASSAEMLALCAAVREHPGSGVEFIPAMGEIDDDRAQLMVDMSLAADRPLNWNLLGSLTQTEIYEQQLASSDRALAQGAYVVALTLPDYLRSRSANLVRDIPGWAEIVDLPEAERQSALSDPSVRARLRASAEKAPPDKRGNRVDWNLVEISEAPDGVGAELVGRTVAEIARERGVGPEDILLDVVVPHAMPVARLHPSLVPSLGTSDEGWSRRAEVWKDPRVILGGSDAGAHLDIMCHANYPTVLLGHAVRERGLLSLETAVHELTEVPARIYGLTDRGVIREGAHADLVVFDPATIASSMPTARTDLPAGESRIYAHATGMRHVFANGVEVVADDRYTGRLGGEVLRSGRHTSTVTLGDMRAVTASGTRK